jgi:hypothetical protein
VKTVKIKMQDGMIHPAFFASRSVSGQLHITMFWAVPCIPNKAFATMGILQRRL